ncbi:MAG: patatin-like phospholipase family protein [Blautia sp.]|jgi:predicted patatin/cPLA2 family phospholipase
MIYDMGLILEGGGMRGVYTAGVLDFFLDQEIGFSEVYGVSAGSCHACSYLSRQRRRAFDVNVDYLKDPRYCSLRSLIKTGDLFGAEMLYDTIPNELSVYDHKAFEEYPGKFYAVVTDCQTGQPRYQQITDMHRDIVWIRASSSLPLVSRMVEIDGVPYLDGGISDSIPLRKSLENGNRKNVVILTRDPSYRKKPGKTAALMKIAYPKYPNLVHQMANRAKKYNKTLDLVQKGVEAGKVFVIRPKDAVHIGRVEKNREKLEALYFQGYQDAAEQYEELMAFLKDEPSSEAAKGDMEANESFNIG